jgi:hypothetical protein
MGAFKPVPFQRKSIFWTVSEEYDDIFFVSIRREANLWLLEIEVLLTLSQHGRLSRHITQGAESPKEARQSRKS